jgi:hypothetical protein
MADIAYRTADVDGLTVFYREAGAPDAPTRFVDTGHFALETHLEEIAAAIGEFLTR